MPWTTETRLSLSFRNVFMCTWVGKNNGWMEQPETFPHLQCKGMKLYHVFFICSLHQENTRVKD